MASALTQTVSQFIPTFEKVEAYNLQQRYASSQHDGEGAEELQHSLVLTQPDNESVTSSRSSKSDKMLKKLDYEAGIRSNRRILRSISKTFHNNAREQAPNSPKRPALRRTLSRTVSNHEINMETKLKQSAASASSTASGRPARPPRNINNLKSNSSTNLKASTYSRALERRDSNAPNIAALRAADRRNSPDTAPVRPDLKNSFSTQRSSDVRTSSNSLRGSGGMKRQSLRSTLAKTTAELNKNIAELAASVDSPRTQTPAVGSPRQSSSRLMSPRMQSVQITKTEQSTTSESPKQSTLKSSAGFARPTSSSALKTSSGSLKNSVEIVSPKMSVRTANALKSPVMSVRSPVNRLRELTMLKRTSETSLLSPKMSVRSPATQSPRTSTRNLLSPAMKASSSSILSPKISVRSPSLKSSGGIRRVPIGGKQDAINVLLHDFETQHRRTEQLSRLELEIYKQEVAKYEEMVAKKNKQDESAVALANTIKEKEAQLAVLFAELDSKQRLYQVSEEELTIVGKEFEAELTEKNAELTAGLSSAAARLQEASQRRMLRDQWKGAEDPVGQARFRVLQAQEDIRDIQGKITGLKKELGRLKNHAGKAKSSDHRLRDEQKLREHMRQTGQVKERGQYVRPKGAPKNNEKKAHVSRLEEEKIKRMQKKAAAASVQRQYTVSDLIMSQHSNMSKSRYGHASPIRGSIGSIGSM